MSKRARTLFTRGRVYETTIDGRVVGGDEGATVKLAR